MHNEGKLSYCSGINQLVGQNIISKYYCVFCRLPSRILLNFHRLSPPIIFKRIKLIGTLSNENGDGVR